MSNVTVHIKNMAGEILPLVLPSRSTLKEVEQRLTAMDRVVYPPFRTKVLRLAQEEEEEEKKGEEEVPLQEEEMLAVFVTSDFTMETGVFPDEPHGILLPCYNGKPYTRYLFPLKELIHNHPTDDILYVYPLRDYPMKGPTNCMFHVSLSSSPLDKTYLFNWGRVLSKLVYMTSPYITRDAMKYIQDTVNAHYQQLQNETGIHCAQLYHAKEVVACDCGAYVQRSGLPAHLKTKKHIKVVGG